MWGNISPPSIQPVFAQGVPTVQTSPGINSSQLQLLDAGAEPRREVKFRPIANSKQTMTMTMGMSMETIVGETPIPKTAIPKVVMKIDLAVGEVEPSGDIHYSLGYSDIQAIADRNISPELTAALQKSFKTLTGIQGRMVITSSGQIKSKSFVFPKTTDPNLKQTFDQFTKSMEQISTRLPPGQVGLGAKWQTTNSLKVSGIQLNQSSTYEIVELNERGMTIKCKVAQSAPPQDLVTPDAGSSSKAKIDSLISSGDGRYALQFDSLFPIVGKLSSATESKMSIQSDPKAPPTNITSKIAIDLNMTGK